MGEHDGVKSTHLMPGHPPPHLSLHITPVSNEGVDSFSFEKTWTALAQVLGHMQRADWRDLIGRDLSEDPQKPVQRMQHEKCLLGFGCHYRAQ